MKLFGYLNKAGLEQVTGAISSLFKGRIFYRTDDDLAYLDNGTSVESILTDGNFHDYVSTNPIELETDIAGVVPVANGGTNIASLVGEAGKALVVSGDESSYEFGESGSGGGSLNYIGSSDAEDGIGDWTSYTNSTLSDAPDDFGGTINTGMQVSQNGVESLRGDFIFRLTSTGDTYGSGIYHDFTIDQVDANKSLYGSHEFFTTSAALYVDDYFQCYVVSSNDNFVSDFNLIEVRNGNLVFGQYLKHEYIFKTDSNLNYRFCIHTTVSTTTSRQYYFDNIKIGPDAMFGNIDIVDPAETITRSGYTSYNPSGHYLLPNHEVDTSNKYISLTQTDHTRITFLKDVEFVATGINRTASAATGAMLLLVTGSFGNKYGWNSASTTYHNSFLSGKASAGDYIVLDWNAGTPVDDDAASWLSVTAFPSDLSENVIAHTEYGDIGEVSAFATDSIPDDFLLCDGTEYLITTHQKLYDKIGITFNLGTETSGYFRVPDLIDEFIRGASATNAVGVAETDEFKSHTHDIIHQYYCNNNGSYLAGEAQIDSPRTHVGAALARGGAETRPQNVRMVFAIRWQHSLSFTVIPEEFIGVDGEVGETGATGADGTDGVGVPVGSIISFAGSIYSLPDGFILCSGAPLSTTSYAALFAVIGYTFGGGGATFYLPSLENDFMRGAGMTRAVATVESWAIQNITGSLYSYQMTHNKSSYSNAGALRFADNGTPSYEPGNTAEGDEFNGITFDASLSVNTSTETRPRNKAFGFIIKY